jgi:E3 ubiquitin-protein ligase UBR1
LPSNLVASIHQTIAIVVDYLVDVWSCSPEQLRLPKTLESIQEDEKYAALHSSVYQTADFSNDMHNNPTKYALVIWNDEKHTIQDVADTVTRACRVAKHVGMQWAQEVDDVGRAVIKVSTDISELLKAVKIIEDPRLSCSIRSCRDIFRERMTYAIVQWLKRLQNRHR